MPRVVFEIRLISKGLCSRRSDLITLDIQHSSVYMTFTHVFGERWHSPFHPADTRSSCRRDSSAQKVSLTIACYACGSGVTTEDPSVNPVY